MAFAAVTGAVPALGWLLFLANVLFSTIYDTEYAMVIATTISASRQIHRDPVRRCRPPIIGILMLTFLFAMLLAGTRAQLLWPYFAASALPRSVRLAAMADASAPARSLLCTFRNNNWVGFAIWIGLC